MKKILFLSGVAMCALTLATSCVKDNESPSVVEIRSAKSEQLKAAAELARAQAAAASLTAQAEANLKNAQAEAQKAQAEIAKAQAEYDQLQNALLEAEMDAEKAEIAARIARAEAEEAAAQQRLQDTLNQIEMDKVQFEYDMAKLIADLENQKAYDEKQKAEAAINELNMAANNYRWAVNNLIDAQKMLNDQKTDLAVNELSQENWESNKAKTIANYNHWIAQSQAQIEVYKQYTNYTEDVQALSDKYNALCLKYDKLDDDFSAAKKEYDKYVEPVAEDAAWDKLYENPFWQMFYNWNYYVTLSDGETQVYLYDTRALWVYYDTSGEVLEKVIATYTTKDGYEEELPVSIYKTASEAAVYIDGFYGKIKEVGADLINMRVREDKAAYAAEKKALEAELKTLNDELKTLKETEAEKLAALNDKEVGAEGYDAAKAAYEAALSDVTAKQSAIDAKTDELKDNSEKSEAYDIIADFVVKYADNCKAVDALYDEILEGKASDNADRAKYWLAYKKAEEEMNEVNAEINAIVAVLYNYSDPLGANELASRIESLENSIKYYQAQIDNYDLNNTSYEQYIETLKKNIALQEEYIKSLEVIANQRKAEYDAVLAKYQN